MSFFVDIVTEDSFYENLTLGVVKQLETNTCIKNVKVERKLACERSVLSSWEQRNCCLLPDDLKSFYASIDGFSLTWSLDIAGEEFPIGKMNINEFGELKRFIGTKEQQNDTDSMCNDDIDLPTFGTTCKLFEIDECDNCKIYLVYFIRPDFDTEPSIWLFNNKIKPGWYKLADNFTKYFRMMLVHIGLPFWQLCVTELSLPTWVEQVYYLVGPHLLPDTVKISDTITDTLWKDGPLNTIDSGIFKSRDNKQKNSRKK